MPTQSQSFAFPSVFCWICRPPWFVADAVSFGLAVGFAGSYGAQGSCSFRTPRFVYSASAKIRPLTWPRDPIVGVDRPPNSRSDHAQSSSRCGLSSVFVLASCLGKRDSGAVYGCALIAVYVLSQPTPIGVVRPSASANSGGRKIAGDRLVRANRSDYSRVGRVLEGGAIRGIAKL